MGPLYSSSGHVRWAFRLIPALHHVDTLSPFFSRRRVQESTSRPWSHLASTARGPVVPVHQDALLRHHGRLLLVQHAQLLRERARGRRRRRGRRRHGRRRSQGTDRRRLPPPLVLIGVAAPICPPARVPRKTRRCRC